MGLQERLGLSSNPFEHYAAETEPHIAAYAVRPPYLDAILSRASALGSYVLFGDRGSGKSATRITIHSKLWNEVPEETSGERFPLTVNVTNFEHLLSDFQKGHLSDHKIVETVAFYVIEQLLVWLSSLPEEEREVFVGALDKEEKTLIVALIEGFYTPIPELARKVSTEEALKLQNSVLTTKSQLWLTQRWSALSRVAGTMLSALSKKNLENDVDISKDVEEIIKPLKSETSNVSRAILSNLVEMSQAFGFSGICILIDKLDETPSTSNSAESTASLIYPLLRHVQLLEVDNFAWIFFLWSNVQIYFEDKYYIRLDKITHSNITWATQGLRAMVEARINFFSKGSKSLSDLFEPSLDIDTIFQELTKLTIYSPRELIKALDVIIREHDAMEAQGALDRRSIDAGLDKYVKETIGSWFPEKILQQVLRLGQESFVNKDVQAKFKISDQGARVKIKNWEETAIVKQDGTSPSESGGKPVYRYTVSDPRVVRIINRKLDEVVGTDLIEAEVVG